MKPCEFCGTPFEPYKHRYRWIRCCSRKCWNNMANASGLWRQIRKTYYDKIRTVWGKLPRTSAGTNHLASDIVIASENHVAQHILPQEGFTEILPLRSRNRYFSCDILAKRGGQLYFVDVTLNTHASYTKEIIEIAKFLGAKILSCHITQDFSKYYLLEPREGSRSTSAGSLFYQEVINHKGNNQMQIEFLGG